MRASQRRRVRCTDTLRAHEGLDVQGPAMLARPPIEASNTNAPEDAQGGSPGGCPKVMILSAATWKSSSSSYCSPGSKGASACIMPASYRSSSRCRGGIPGSARRVTLGARFMPSLLRICALMACRRTARDWAPAEPPHRVQLPPDAGVVVSAPAGGGVVGGSAPADEAADSTATTDASASAAAPQHREESMAHRGKAGTARALKYVGATPPRHWRGQWQPRGRLGARRRSCRRGPPPRCAHRPHCG